MDCSEKLATPLSHWPAKLASVMEIHRRRFSQLNPRFKRQPPIAITVLQPLQQPFVRPTVLPSAPRPQPRQQRRAKPTPAPQLTQRANSAYVKQQQSASTDCSPPYITLANLTKILHVLQTQVKINESEASIDTSTTTTTNSSKQRVQQHLQETAARWWKPTRSSDGQSSILPSHDAKLSVGAVDVRIAVEEQRVLQVTDSNSSTGTGPSDDAVKTPMPAKLPSVRSARVEPIIMPPRNMRLYSTANHRYFSTPNGVNLFQQQRLVR